MEAAQTVDWLAITGLVAGLVSIVIGMVAIALSVAFYFAAKGAESAVNTALAGIEAQTQLLAEISTRHLKDLVGLVSQTARPPETTVDTMTAFAIAIRGLPQSAEPGLLQPQRTNETPHGETISNHGIPQFPAAIDKTMVRDNFISLYYALYFYTAFLNVTAQGWLPNEEDYSETDRNHKMAREMLDLTAWDFRLMANALDLWVATEPDYVRGHRLYQLFGVSGQALMNSVRNASEEFAHRRDS